MNQDQVKSLLLKLKSDVPEFSVTFTGKSSKKVHGLYKPESKEILLHNKNFKNDQELLYTAIHEFAHHLHFSSNLPPQSSRAHTTMFWSLFHGLLRQATEQGWYKDAFEEDAEFKILTAQLKNDYLKPHGKIMKDFGGLLLQAAQLCLAKGLPFEDYCDRVLQLPKMTARVAMASFKKDVSSEFGFDAMKMLARAPQKEVQQTWEDKLQEGYSLDQVRQEFKPESISQPKVDENPDAAIRHLEQQREMVKRKILSLEARLAQLDQALKGYSENDSQKEI